MKRALLSALLGISSASIVWGGGTVTWPTPPIPADANPAATVTGPLTAWLNHFERDLQASRKMDNIDLVFDGDNPAITAGQYGPKGGMWQRFTRIKAFDFSYPGDTTQTILWRLENGELGDFHPKLIVLDVGGSNIGPNTPAQIAEGVKAVIAGYQKHCPDAIILLQGIFPRGEKPTDPGRAKVKAVNDLISALGDGKKVIYLDFGDKLLQPDGTISKDTMVDFLHPSAKAYKIWADAIQPVVDQVFPPATLPPAPKVEPEVAADATTNSAANELTPALDATSPIIGGGTVTWPPPPLPPGGNSAVVPAPHMARLELFQQRLDESRKMAKIDLIFDGDSITAGWKGAGGGVWGHHYVKLNAYDFGVSGDNTQGLLWRLQNGQVAGLHPKLIVLLIGTNNMNSCSAEQIAGGIKADVEEYEKQCPEASILLQGIFPRGEKSTDGIRAKVKAVNQIISALGDGKKVIYLDFGEKLLTPDGSFTKPITNDFLHPTAPGYEIWSAAIQPVIDQFFPPASK